MFTTINVHGIFGLFILFELIFNHIEFKWNHFWFVLTQGALYGLTNMLVVYFTGDPVYSVIDYKSYWTVFYILCA